MHVIYILLHNLHKCTFQYHYKKKEYIEIVEQKVERNPFANREIKRDKKLSLTDEQQKAFDKIKDSNFNEFLIYGVTGSRKNRNLFAINRECIK